MSKRFVQTSVGTSCARQSGASNRCSCTKDFGKVRIASRFPAPQPNENAFKLGDKFELCGILARVVGRRGHKEFDVQAALLGRRLGWLQSRMVTSKYIRTRALSCRSCARALSFFSVCLYKWSAMRAKFSSSFSSCDGFCRMCSCPLSNQCPAPHLDYPVRFNRQQETKWRSSLHFHGYVQLPARNAIRVQSQKENESFLFKQSLDGPSPIK